MERVDLMLNDICNINCIFCYHKGMVGKRYDFGMKKVENTLIEGRGLGYTEVYISGGEPTLNENLLDIIRIAKGMGYKDIKIMTNGLRMRYEKYIRALVKAGLNKIAFSLHGGTAEVHDMHTGVKGSFGHIKMGMQNASKLRNSVSSEINTVVTRHNIEKLDRIAELAHNLGIGSLHLQLVVPNSPVNRSLHPPRVAVERIFREMIDRWEEKLAISYAFVPFCYMKGYERYISKLDFTEPFLSNCVGMFESWKESLLRSKKLGKECVSCPHLKYCRGIWT